MPIAVFSFKLDPDRQVRVLHVFFAESKTTADNELQAHAQGCPSFGPAFRSDETVEFAREIEEMPPADPDELEEWLDELLSEELEDAEDEPIDMVPE